jgi:hypothetical protein
MRGGILRLILISSLAVIILLYKLPDILELSQGMTRRFVDSDMATFWGRVESIAYLFRNIWNPLWWIPHGTADFLVQHGGLPHSAPTVVFLQAGLFGLVGWFILLMWPVLRGLRLVWRRAIPPEHAAIVIAALISLVASLSLPAPFFEQCWLWGGAAWGVIVAQQNTADVQVPHG